MSWLVGLAYIGLLLFGLRDELREQRRLARMARELRECRP
jgi:hypothetical protein